MDRRLGRAHRDLDAAHDRNQELERELDLAGLEIYILRTQISKQEREINDLRNYLATSDHSLNRVRDALRASENALTAARSDNADLNALRSERDTLPTERNAVVPSSARLEGHDHDRISDDLTRVQEMYADEQEEITKLRDSKKDVDADLDQTAALLAAAADKLRVRRAGKVPGKRARSRSTSPDAGQPVPKKSARGISAPPDGRSSSLAPASSAPLSSKGRDLRVRRTLALILGGSPDRDDRNQPEIIEIQD
ncbi:hypothetical protein PC116_g28303 [Phytophthora cactorum]|uniref:Uncharacterized protein n=1 Tax=Phytophthora cactorum TaxID=29920 RepID=A0A8T1JF57_9STRA|nr:hypothetical protein PC112_g23829 [Phytophthora cactorum]KAG2799872.1 hypothetical protein PC111_g20231 [Phytophthora cactorum]KAG2883631.1 hypothetical protein PC117_g25980 [Phytophthora cactorum]KAG2960985.1 hypothetical protein PC119_g26243 [Phytophthora cactorum]KAG2969938.1 hypothetical protein PC120_g26643 [Phytophthora cactorum]